jgi:hypothetical protein
MAALIVAVLFATPPVSASRTAPAVEYVDLTLRWSRGGVTVVRTARGRWATATELPRYRGRFEARALRAGTVLERVRFDFPLLASAEAEDVTDEARAAAARIRAGVTSSTTTVRVPLYEGAEAVEVRDGISGRVVTVKVPAVAPPPDAGADGPPAR